jgi:hypothetical protein
MMLAMQPTFSERLGGGALASYIIVRRSVSDLVGKWKLTSSSSLIVS